MTATAASGLTSQLILAAGMTESVQSLQQQLLTISAPAALQAYM
jgi:hypothetical protein